MSYQNLRNIARQCQGVSNYWPSYRASRNIENALWTHDWPTPTVIIICRDKWPYFAPIIYYLERPKLAHFVQDPILHAKVFANFEDNSFNVYFNGVVHIYAISNKTLNFRATDVHKIQFWKLPGAFSTSAYQQHIRFVSVLVFCFDWNLKFLRGYIHTTCMLSRIERHLIYFYSER